MLASQRIHCEVIVPWRRLFVYITLYLCVITIGITLKGITFSMVVFTLLWAGYWLLYGCLIVEMDTQAIEFGFRFTGRERLPFEAIDQVEILSLEDRNPEIRSLLRESTPPVILAGHYWPPYPVIRLRLKREQLTHYRLRRKRLVQEFLFLSRKPAKVLSLLSQNGVPTSPNKEASEE